MKILVINGPNMNLLGIREPEKYGRKTYEDLCEMIRKYADEKKIETELFQSNSEGEIVTAIQRAYFEKFDGIIINPAGYSHTSVAILDALLAVSIPTVEVHVTDPDLREEFRHKDFVAQAAFCRIKGEGLEGYLKAIDALLEKTSEKSSER